MLWSFNGWTNKDWVLQEMLKSELSVIKNALKQLLYGEAPIAERFDRATGHVRRLGAASASEILAHHNRYEYPIWNSRSRKGLISLRIDDSRLPKSAQISGEQYAAFCDLAKDVLSQVVIVDEYFQDLLALDFLLYFISLKQFTDADISAAKVDYSDSEDFDHDAVIDQVLELGDGLGFEVAKEFTVVRGCRIDAIWRSRVANLGTIAYAFEVHRKGSRDSAILNLQRVRSDPAIQKVVLVSTQEELDIFRSEVAALPESFRTSIGYFEVEDLQRALIHLGSLKDILNGLGLLSAEALFD